MNQERASNCKKTRDLGRDPDGPVWGGVRDMFHRGGHRAPHSACCFPISTAEIPGNVPGVIP